MYSIQIETTDPQFTTTEHVNVNTDIDLTQTFEPFIKDWCKKEKRYLSYIYGVQTIGEGTRIYFKLDNNDTVKMTIQPIKLNNVYDYFDNELKWKGTALKSTISQE